MIRVTFLFTLISIAFSCTRREVSHELPHDKGPITLVIHGGAGTILREKLTPEKERAYRTTMVQALDSGFAVLETGGIAQDAVVAAIVVLENSPLFNAGKGAVFTHEGRNEMDAAIMEGKNLNAGAVAGITTIKNPITAAVAVMIESPHVMMGGKGADTFAAAHGCEVAPPEYFYDSARYRQLLEILGESANAAPGSPGTQEKYGTVGAVALDQFGNLAAGTSTGGMTNKQHGRIGDSPIIGAGTYANNLSCAVSATGHGEFFIRSVAAYQIAALYQHTPVSLATAADSVVMKSLLPMGGSGGVIALARNGDFVMSFNSEGMYRGFIQKKGEAQTFIFKND